MTYHYSYGTDMPLHCSGKLYFGADHLLRRRVMMISRLPSRPATSGGIVTTTMTFHKIETNFPTPAPVTFAYTPPAEVKPHVELKPDADGWIQVSPGMRMRNRGSYWEVVHDAHIVTPATKKKRDSHAH